MCLCERNALESVIWWFLNVSWVLLSRTYQLNLVLRAEFAGVFNASSIDRLCLWTTMHRARALNQFGFSKFDNVLIAHY